MARVQYERVKKRLDPTDVDRAIWPCRNPSEKAHIVEWADTECIGLVLRITKRDSNWLIRRRDCTIRIGSCNEIGLRLARDVAQKTRAAAKRGRNLKTFVERLVAYSTTPQGEYYDSWKDKNDLEYADTIADEKSDWGRRWLKGEHKLTWTWKNLTDQFLAAKLKTLKKSYRQEYEHYLRLPEFKTIEDVLVKDLDIDDLEMIRDRMLKAYARSTVSRAVRQAREMLTWAWSYHIKESGLKNCQWEWWTRWRVEYRSKVRTRRPTVEELARTMVLANEFRNLAEGEHETYPGTVCALWMAVLTAQRTGSLLMMRPDRLFTPDRKLKLHGWKIVNWTSEEMKGGRNGGRPHSLPIPPRAVKVLERFRAEDSHKSEWMFSAKQPQDRLTQSALNLLMYRLQGRVFDHRKKNKPDRPGKPGPKPAVHGKIRKDLFAEFGIKPWTLHDVRRSLTRFLDDRRLGGAASAILGHKLQNDKMPEEERMAEVTEIHYNSSQRISLKGEGLKLWVDTILDACERERIKIKKQRRQQPLSQAISSPAAPELVAEPVTG
jgi:integrase